MEEFTQHVINGLNLGAVYALVALGYTMVYGVLQLINFAHSEVYMMSAFAAYYGAAFGLGARPGWGTLGLTLVVAVLGGALLGLMIERFAYRPMRRAPKVNALITAIGVSLFLQFSAQVVFGADPKTFPAVLTDRVLWSLGAIQIRLLDVTILAVALGSMAVLHYFINHTRPGLAIRATSFSFRSATLMGINVNTVVTMTFMVGSGLAGVGSVLVAIKWGKIDPLMGTLIGLKAFSAAVLGGIGSLPGAVLGGLLMGLCEEMVVGYWSSTYRDALAFALLIVILLLKPAGLLGRPTLEKV